MTVKFGFLNKYDIELTPTSFPVPLRLLVIRLPVAGIRVISFCEKIELLRIQSGRQ